MSPTDAGRDVVAEVERVGPIGFDRYMEIVLYGQHGYYATGPLRSNQGGDFLTSAEVSSLFGETLAAFVAAERERIGEPFTLAEVGGGSGSLLRPLLDSLPDPPPVICTEQSAAAREALTRLVPEAVIVDEPHIERGVLLANELLDTMPAALAVKRGERWIELQVAIDDGADGLVVPVLVETSPRPEVAAWADEHAGPVPEGGQVEVQLEATGWVEAVCHRLQAGAVLLIDYGELSENLQHRRAEGTLRTYHRHHLGPDPLLEPGMTDVTMDVAFSAMIDAAERGGAEVTLLRQDDFLEQWGLRDRLEELRAAEVEAAREGRAMERLQLRSRVTEVETLLHPRGLGDFRVLVAQK